MKYIQRCKQRQWDIYTKMRYKQRHAMRYIDIYKDVNKCEQCNEIYTKM